MPAAPHAPAPAKKRGFFCNPIHLDRPAQAKERRKRYADFVKLMSGNERPAEAARVLFSTMAGKDYGDHHVISSKKMLDEMGRGISSSTKAEALRLVAELEASAHPASQKKGVHQITRIISQLKRLGHEVEVRDYGDPSHRRFILLAKKRGAKVVRAPFSDAGVETPWVPGMPEAMRGRKRYLWARDQHTDIGGRRVKPRSLTDPWMGELRHKEFGEGGTLLRINDKEFVTSEGFRDHPDLLDLQNEGIRFHFMPNGMRFHDLLTHTLRKPTYAESTHLDYVLNVIPRAGVLAVDNYYYWRHHAQVRALQKALKLRRLVVVSKAESRHHPTNFLELGDGRVLAARNCPNFIYQLREAGVEVVETDVDLDEFVHNGGGLRCFFNELD